VAALGWGAEVSICFQMELNTLGYYVSHKCGSERLNKTLLGCTLNTMCLLAYIHISYFRVANSLLYFVQALRYTLYNPESEDDYIVNSAWLGCAITPMWCILRHPRFRLAEPKRTGRWEWGGGGYGDGRREVFCLTKLSGATINTVSDRLVKHEYDTLKELY
jgi:hypothetical protein